MSNRRKLRPHQRAAQDQALAAARDAAATAGAAIATYQADPDAVCVYAEAHDTECLGGPALHGVQINVRGVDEQLDYAACAAHILWVLNVAMDSVRRCGLVDQFDLQIDRRLDSVADPLTSFTGRGWESGP